MSNLMRKRGEKRKKNAHHFINDIEFKHSSLIVMVNVNLDK